MNRQATGGIVGLEESGDISERSDTTNVGYEEQWDTAWFERVR